MRRFNNQNKVSPIYLLPNVFTLGAMFCGFFAIVMSIKGNFIDCGIAIFFAMILDSLDGRVARLTHTSSPFGAQLDSLSDMVAFGVAPAIKAFNWHLHTLGKIGWLFAFIYCACASLRLARFNTMIGMVDKRFFVGLPSPSADAFAVELKATVLDYKNYHYKNVNFQESYFTLAAFSMVSNIRFYSFKEFNFYHKAKFRALLIFLVGLALLIAYPDLFIYGFFVIYTITSYVMYIFRIGYNKKPIQDKRTVPAAKT